jgi:DNA replication protein DnaC
MSKEKIEETLKRLAADTSAANSPITSRADPEGGGMGDPECPYCGGQGYLRHDVQPGHPDFGRLEICPCRTTQVREQLRERLFRLSHLDQLKHLTFENFNPHGRMGIGEQAAFSIERAYNQAQLFTESREGWLLLQGGYGCGKTHLAASIANRCVSLAIPTLFLTVPDLLDNLRFSYESEEFTFEERFDQIRTAPLLILDDFGTQNATPWACEKLFQILNYRYINHLPMVLTTNLSLDELDGRIRSRLADPGLVTQVRILAPDYRRPVDDLGHHELSSLVNHAHQTFGTFSLRKREKLPSAEERSLEKAFEAARRFAEEPSGWQVFLGTFGCGKTHLAAAIANYQASQGKPVMFVVVPDLLDHLRATFNPNSPVTYDRRFEEVRSAPLLVLDDLGTQATTPWVKEKLYQLFNHRYTSKLPTLITSADTLEEIDARLRARMLDQRLCAIYVINAPSYRGGTGRAHRSRS